MFRDIFTYMADILNFNMYYDYVSLYYEYNKVSNIKSENVSITVS